MDIIAFISAQRQEVQLLADYNAYRALCTRRLATLRKRLQRVNSKSKKFTPAPPVTAEDLAAKPEHAHLFLLAAERAWAHGMHMRALVADDPESASPSLRAHVISRLHKASAHASALCTLLTPSSAPAPTALFEAHAYASLLAGAEAFEKEAWKAALSAFATVRVIFATLAKTAATETYRELQRDTVDPSVRYAAYQLQLPRSLDIASICRQFFPRDDRPDVVGALQQLDARVFDEQSDAAQGAGTVSSVAWRGRTAEVEEADVSVALADAQSAETAFYTAEEGGMDVDGDGEGEGNPEAFDTVLAAWQNAVDTVKRVIEERTAEGMAIGDPKMQNLQLTWTVVNYSLVSWRVGRNRVMIRSIGRRPKNSKRKERKWNAKEKKGSEKQEGSSKEKEKSAGASSDIAKPSHSQLKELSTLYSAILQSLATIPSLPGVAADTMLTTMITAKENFFRAQNTAVIARSHTLLPDHQRETLALFYRAYQYAAAAVPGLPIDPEPPRSSWRGLDVKSADAAALREELQCHVDRWRGLCEIRRLEELERAAGSKKHTGVLIDRLGEWTDPATIDLKNGLVEWPPKLQPVPVKPVFMDIAWNFIKYPGEKERQEEQRKKEQEQEQSKKSTGGLLGKIWGR